MGEFKEHSAYFAELNTYDYFYQSSLIVPDFKISNLLIRPTTIEYVYEIVLWNKKLKNNWANYAEIWANCETSWKMREIQRK